MLSTEFTREDYLERAEARPLLAEALAGTTSLAGTLDSLVEGLRERTGWSSPLESGPWQRFEEYFTLVSELSRTGADDNEIYRGLHESYVQADNIASKRSFLKGSGQSAGVMLAGGLIAAIPPLWIVGTAFCALGALGYAFSGIATLASADLGAHPRHALGELYSRAEALDADIGRAFLYDDVEQNRERFGQTYRALAEEERALVGQDLHRMLAAGALDMGGAELKRYLSSLGENEVTSDA